MAISTERKQYLDAFLSQLKENSFNEVVKQTGETYKDVNKFNDATYNRYKGYMTANPYLNNDSKAIVNSICDKLCGDKSEERFATEIESTALSFISGQIESHLNAKQGEPFYIELSDEEREYIKSEQEKTKAQIEASREKSKKLEKEIESMENAVKILNGSIDIENNPGLDKVFKDHGTSYRFARSMGTYMTAAPDNVPFVCESFESVKLEGENSFSEKVSKGTALTSDEKHYGVATFDRAMNGLYGGEGNSSEPKEIDANHPMYLGKFDYIFVDGKSVRDLCAEKIKGMELEEMSDYMKCFTSACAVSRDKRIECIVPNVEFKKNEQTGLDEKVYKLPIEAHNAKIVPIMASVANEKSPSLWHTIQASVNRVSKQLFGKDVFTLDKTTNYDYTAKFQENDMERVERHQSMKGTLAEANERQERDSIRKIYKEANEALLKNTHPEKYHDPRVGDKSLTINDVQLDGKSANTGGFSYFASGAGRRVGIINAYMYSQGIPLDKIALDSSPEMDKLRNEKAKEFMNLINNGSPEEIAQTFADMSKKVIEYEIPKDIDFTNQKDLAKYYAEMRAIESIATNLNSIVEMRMGDDGKQNVGLSTENKEVSAKFKEIIGDEKNIKKLSNGFNNAMNMLGYFGGTKADYMVNDHSFSPIGGGHGSMAKTVSTMTTAHHSHEILNAMRGNKLFQMDTSQAKDALMKIDGTSVGSGVLMGEFANLNPNEKTEFDKQANAYMMGKTKNGPLDDKVVEILDKEPGGFVKSELKIDPKVAVTKEFDDTEIKLKAPKIIKSMSFDSLSVDANIKKNVIPPSKKDTNVKEPIVREKNH
ncbi:MAG: hypothetical protein FWD48_05350 [Oscillospiraceae bacterium]|nr:hypothetical protein [Oscillospiraceae bacterium]